MFKGHDKLLIAARHGAPLAVGYGDTEMYLGSDAMALAPFTSRLSYLLDGDWAVITPKGVTIRNGSDAIVQRETLVSQASALLVDKGNHRHFMAKEIYEQPETIAHTLSHYVDMGGERVALREKLPFDFAKLEPADDLRLWNGILRRADREVLVRALCAAAGRRRCGARVPLPRTAGRGGRRGALHLAVGRNRRHAGGAALLRRERPACGQPAQRAGVDDRPRKRSGVPDAVRTGDRRCFDQGTDGAAHGARVPRDRGRRGARYARSRAGGELVRALVELPAACREALNIEAQIEEIAKGLSKAKDVLYLGRGQMFPVAMEGALKLKEISYIHAEGYAAGELKHGPIALVDEVMPVIVVAPSDELMEKTLCNMQEVAARGGKIILITDEKGKATSATASPRPS